MKFLVLILFGVTVVICCADAGRQGFTPIFANEWVIELKNDKDVTHIAQEYGLVCPKKILDTFYKCHKIGIVKRDVRENHAMKRKLTTDNRISWFEQKRIMGVETELTEDVCPVTPVPAWMKKTLWYLNNSPENKSLNVLPAWKNCFTGNGIKVAVVDGGIYRRGDLAIDETLSTSRQDENSARHGTRVAGILGGRTNSLCCAGVAYNALLIDRPLFSNPNRGYEDFAESLSYNHTVIDIFSNSWTSRSTGVTLGKSNRVVERAIEIGATKGRHGKGSIYVWGSGNGGEDDGCAYDAYMQSRYAIVVGSADSNLKQLATAENCSAIMITALSRDTFNTSALITTDGDGEYVCTDNFGYNSASVPMVSGAIALALEANSNMTRRDIVHAIVNSAVSDLPFQPSNFIRNKAGYNVSESFGFGLLNIGKLVHLSDSWKNVPPEMECIYSNSSGQWLPNTESIIEITDSNCPIRYLEHVKISFSLYCLDRGNLQLFLESPGQTKSVILKGRRWDKAEANPFNWSVVSLHFWGERPVGKWKLQATNRESAGKYNGYLFTWSLAMYGTAAAPFQGIQN